jgi:hypothetical protein
MGSYDARVLAGIEQLYGSHRTTNFVLNYLDGDPFQLGGGKGPPNTVADIKGFIDYAVAQRGWLILCFHQLAAKPKGSLQFGTAAFSSVLDYLKQRKVKVVTVSEGVALMRGTTAAPPPALTGVSPASGPTAGGTSVALAGSGFGSGASVTFGGAAATVTAWAPTSLQVTTPPHAAGAVDVRVTNPDGQAVTLAGAFSYADAPPPPGGGSSTVVPLGAWSWVGVTLAQPASYQGRTAQRLAEAAKTSWHYLVSSDGARASGTWELTAVAHAGTSSKLYLQLDAGAAPYPQARFDLATGKVNSVLGDGTVASASVDDLGSGWYGCRLLVSGVRPANAVVSMLNDQWANSYPGDARHDLHLSELTLDPR